MHLSTWLLAHGEDLQLGVYVGLLVCLAVVERLVPGRATPMARAVRWPANVVLTVVNVVALSVLPFSLFGAAVWAETRGWGLLYLWPLPAAVSVPLVLVVRGFISFVTHYAMHMVPALWRIHRVHHLDTELDVTSTVRFHPLEFAIGVLPGIPIVILFGLTPWVLVLYELLDVAVTLWSHANIRIPRRLDGVLRWVVVTPDVHRIHHSTWQPETNSNFGAVFTVWDRVFGTFRGSARESPATMPLGLDEVRGDAAHRPLWLLGGALARLDPPDRSASRGPEGLG